MEKHEAYSVLITDDKGRRGTGTLFYTEGSQTFYVLTCAHVIYLSEYVDLHLLIATAHDPEEKVVRAYKRQFHFSPIDEVKVTRNNSTHTCDIAVIECDKEDLRIEPTGYSMFPMTTKEQVVALGYPKGNFGALYFQQDLLHAQVERVLDSQNFFLVRVNDPYINQADRVSELEGFSGSPVWDENKLNEAIYLFGGLIAFGADANISRGRVSVMQARLFQSLMREEFGINIDTRIPSIPQEDIAPGYQEENTADQKAVRTSWIESIRKKGQTYIDVLQLQKAIDICDGAISNSEFAKCSVDEKYRIYAIILEAYRLARDYDTYDKIKCQMHAAGVYDKRENLIDAVRYYEACEDDKAKEYINKALDQNPDGNEERVIDLAIRIVGDENADESALSEFIGEQDQLLVEPKDADEEASIYHMLSYLFAQKFKNPVRALRCQNRAFQISGSYIILEQLGLTYYYYSLRDAFIDKDSDRIDRLKLDNSSLDKARDSFLRILSAGDELWIKGSFSRAGLPIFKCFYFLHDEFRIYKHYHDVIKYYDFHNRDEKRDIQICYLETAIRKESVDLKEFDALNDFDRSYFELVQLLENPMRQFDFGLAVKAPVTEAHLLSILEDAEKRLASLVDQGRNIHNGPSFDGIHVAMINLYGNGIQRFRWEALTAVKHHFAEVKHTLSRESLAIYLDELEYNDFERSEKKFENFFNKHLDVITFNEWCHFYTRHGRFDKTKELYDSVFDDRKFLIKDLPEYFYREYINLYMVHGYDITTPIKCFVDHGNEFKDIFIKIFFELQLNFAACTFNNPDAMLEDSRMLLDEGVIDERDYKEKCLIINMLNCRPKEAEKYADPTHELKPDLASPYERILYVWKGHPVQTDPHWKAMQYYTRREVERKYRKEKWHKNFQEILDRYNTFNRREIVVDLWGIYYLGITGNIGFLNRFRKIYISHVTVSAALQEINAINDKNIRMILTNFLQVRNLVIESPNIEQQLEIRNPEMQYMEIHQNLLLAELKNCAAFVGEFRFDIPDQFKDRVIRPNLYEMVDNYMFGIRLLYGK